MTWNPKVELLYKFPGTTVVQVRGVTGTLSRYANRYCDHGYKELMLLNKELILRHLIILHL